MQTCPLVLLDVIGRVYVTYDVQEFSLSRADRIIFVLVDFKTNRYAVMRGISLLLRHLFPKLLELGLEARVGLLSLCDLSAKSFNFSSTLHIAYLLILSRASSSLLEKLILVDLELVY